MEQGAGLWSGFGTTADSKEESIQDKNGNQWTEGPVEEQNGLETRKVKQRSTSKDRMEFCLREQGVGDERGKVPVSVRQGKEFINGKILLHLGLVTSRSSYTGSVFKVFSGRIRIESVVQVIFDV